MVESKKIFFFGVPTFKCYFSFALSNLSKTPNESVPITYSILKISQMNFILNICLILFVGFTLNAQTDTKFDNNKENILLEKNEFNGIIWAQDSSYYYTTDSSAYILSSITRVQERDQWGNSTKYLQTSWDETTQTEQNVSKGTFSYDANANRLSRSTQSWDNTNSVWINSYQDFYTFDLAGNRTNWLRQLGNGIGWEYSYQYSYYYDQNNNDTLQIRQNWNTGIGSWENAFKISRTYDANNNVIYYSSYSWDNATNNWVNAVQQNYVYNAANSVTLRTTQRWDTLANVWFNTEKMVRVYDSNNYQTEIRFEQWDTVSGAWINNTSVLSINNANGNSTLVTSRNWDDSAAVWLNDNQWIYNWDANSNLLFSSFLSWDIGLSTWEGNYRYNYTFNTYNSKTEDLREDWNGSTWVNTFKNVYIFDANNNLSERTSENWNIASNMWDNSTKYSYYWSQINVVDNMNTLDINNLKVYPNPVVDKLYIEGDYNANLRVSIYTISGQLKSSKTVNNGSIDVQAIPNGIYFLKVPIKGVIQLIKFIKV